MYCVLNTGSPLSEVPLYTEHLLHTLTVLMHFTVIEVHKIM